MVEAAEAGADRVGAKFAHQGEERRWLEGGRCRAVEVIFAADGYGQLGSAGWCAMGGQ
jgi:hypothetical protein